MNQDQQKLVPAVERAIAILDIVSTARRYPTISELSRELDLPKSTVHGLCRTLAHLGLLIRRPDQTYRLGPHVLRWANAFGQQTDVATEFAALWEETDVFPEATVTLGVPEDNDIVFIASRQSSAGERLPVKPGTRLPAPFCAAGQAILSGWSDFEIRKAYANGLPQVLTAKSPTNVDELLDAVKAARRLGYALEKEECYEGITSLGSPVLNSFNRPLAAIMISVPSEAMIGEVGASLADTVVTMSDRLSRRMGAEMQVAGR